MSFFLVVIGKADRERLKGILSVFVDLKRFFLNKSKNIFNKNKLKNRTLICQSNSGCQWEHRNQNMLKQYNNKDETF